MEELISSELSPTVEMTTVDNPNYPRIQVKQRIYEPIGDRIIVIPDVSEDVTSGGIHVVDAAKEPTFTGTVEAVAEMFPQSYVGKKVCWGEVFNLKLPKNISPEQDRLCLRMPQETKFFFHDLLRDETDAEYLARVNKLIEAEENAKAADAVRAELRAEISKEMADA
jgi:hypothetical protein